MGKINDWLDKSNTTVHELLGMAVALIVIIASPEPLFVVGLAFVMFVPIWLRLYFATMRGRAQAIKILKRKIKLPVKEVERTFS
jgi:hypothetical protein